LKKKEQKNKKKKTKRRKKSSFGNEISHQWCVGSVGFFRAPGNQDFMGDELAAEGIRVAFGEPMQVEGYPAVQLSWYRTQRVVKWSGVVRQEKAKEYYEKHGVALGAVNEENANENRNVNQRSPIKPLATDKVPETVEEEEEVPRSPSRFEDGARKGGLGTYDSQDIANTIKQRRNERNLKSPRKQNSREAMEEKRKNQEEELYNKSMDAVQKRAAELN
jgi:hypothetical protein